MKKILIRTTVFFLALLCLGVMAAVAQAPNSLSYQGRLTNTAGDAIDSVTQVSFSIHSALSGGSRLWIDTIAVSPDSSGIFTVELAAISTTVFQSGNKLYLEIEVVGDSPMTPRQLLTSAPYAYAAGMIADLSVTNAKLASNAVTAAKIAPGAVGISEIGTNAVGSDEIAANAVGSSEITANAVGASEIATGAVGASEIATGAVGASEIAANAVGNSEIASGAVGNIQLASNAVDASKIFDEVGQSWIEDWNNYTLPTTTTDIMSKSIIVPATGHVLAIATGKFIITHINGSISSGMIAMYWDPGGTYRSASECRVEIPANAPTGTYIIPAISQYLFDVSAGTTTIYLKGDRNAASIVIDNRQFTLIYIPSDYEAKKSNIASDGIDTDGMTAEMNIETNTITQDGDMPILLEDRISLLEEQLERLLGELEKE